MEDESTNFWDYEHEAAQEVVPDDQSTEPAEVQLAEAFAIASEANRTLQEAREAVRQVRQSRGYYTPESASGKGMTPPPAFSPSASPMARTPKGNDKGKTGKGFGPCFICGMRGHGYQQCPDRFAKGKAKQKGSGKFKGPKGKSKFGKGGKTYFVDLTCIMSA